METVCVYDGTAKKQSDGKPPLDILMRFPIMDEVAFIFEDSSKKYPDLDGDFNFRKGVNKVGYKRKLISACLRHVSKWCRGEKLDAESGKSHISHAICNLMMVGDLDILEVLKP